MASSPGKAGLVWRGLAVVLASLLVLTSVYLGVVDRWFGVDVDDDGATDIALRLIAAAAAFVIVALTRFRVWLDVVAVSLIVMIAAAIPATWMDARDASAPVEPTVTLAIERTMIESSLPFTSGQKAVLFVIVSKMGEQGSVTVESERFDDVVLPQGFDPEAGGHVNLTLARGEDDARLDSLYVALTQAGGLHLVPPRPTADE